MDSALAMKMTVTLILSMEVKWGGGRGMKQSKPVRNEGENYIRQQKFGDQSLEVYDCWQMGR